MKPVFGLVLLLSVASLSHAYYYNEEGEVEDDGFAESSGRARSLYTRSIKSAPLSPSRKSYTPPSPSRARLSAPAPAVKGYEPQQQQRFEQQTYEAQSQVPKINHEVVSSSVKIAPMIHCKAFLSNNQLITTTALINWLIFKNLFLH